MMEHVKSGPSEGLHVLIIGAGITGLLIAQGLQKAGISYQIFDGESAESVRPREWTLGVNWSIPNLEKLLPSNLFARLREAYCDPYRQDDEVQKNPMYNSSTGELLHEVLRPGGIDVSRRRMRVLCNEGISVEYERAFREVEFRDSDHKIVAHFADGSTATGDILIGADGTRSEVRGQLLGPEKSKRTPCHLHLTTATVKYDSAEKAKIVRSGDAIAAFGYHPDGIFNMVAIQTVPDLKDPTTWEFYLACSWIGEADPNLDNAGRLATLKNKIQDKLVDPFRGSVMWISDETPVYNDKLQYWVPVPWDNRNGRITLAGDAAHPMPPYRGQGLAHCICDAANLVDALQRVNQDSKLGVTDNHLGSAISAYDEEVIRRGAEEVNLSVQSMYMVHDWEKLMDSPIIKMGSGKATT